MEQSPLDEALNEKMGGDPYRACSMGHMLTWLSIVGQCDSCGQQFVALRSEPVICFRCGGNVSRIKCSENESRENVIELA